MQFLAIAAALAIPALALPGPVAGGSSLAARDNVKLNQYSNIDDCNNDANILYHAAPPSGTCYNLDDATGAMFINTAGFLASKLYDQINCGGNWIGVTGGTCLEKSQWRSFKLQ